MNKNVVPGILGLRTTAYKVPDIEKAKEWYCKAFGIAPYFDEPYYVGFNICGYELGLLQNDNDQVVGDNVLSYWGVKKIDITYSWFLECGASEHEKPTNVGGELMVSSVKDPWGNLIGFIYNPYFKLP